MLTVTEEAREYLANLLAEVRGQLPQDACLRIELSDQDDPMLSFSEETASDHSAAYDGDVILVWDDQVESDLVERTLVLYEELGASGQSLFLLWSRPDGRPTARSVALREEVQEALEELDGALMMRVT